MSVVEPLSVTHLFAAVLGIGWPGPVLLNLVWVEGGNVAEQT